MSKLMHVVYWLVIVVLGSLLWREYQAVSSHVDTVSVGAEKSQDTDATEGVSKDSKVSGTSDLTVQLAPPSGHAADESQSLPAPESESNATAELASQAANDEATDDATAKMLAQFL